MSLTDERTTNYALPLPHPANEGADDCLRLRKAISGADAAIKTVADAAASKADAANIDAALVTVNANLALKANLSVMDTELARKADVSTVTTELSKKADAVEMTTALVLKADVTTMTTELSKKANSLALTAHCEENANTHAVLQNAIKAAADKATWAGLTGKPETFPPETHRHTTRDITDAPCLLSIPILMADEKMALGKQNTIQLTAGKYSMAPLEQFELTITVNSTATTVLIPAPETEKRTVEYKYTPDGAKDDSLTLSAVSVDKLGNRSLPAEQTIMMVDAYIAAPDLRAPMHKGTLIIGDDDTVTVSFVTAPFISAGIEDVHIASQYRITTPDGLVTLHDSEETETLQSYTCTLTGLHAGDTLCQARHRGQRFGWSAWGQASTVAVRLKCFVAVGEDGIFSSSRDGVEWSYVNSFVPNIDNAHCIIYSNGKFVLCGHNCYVSTSTDGVTWTPAVTIPEMGVCCNIIYAADKFALCELYGYVSMSPDGITWTEAVQVPGIDSCSGITCSDGTFMVLGYRFDDNIHYVSTSTDGITWTPPVKVSDPQDSFSSEGILFGNGTFLAYYRGKVFTSGDGVTWTEASVVPGTSKIVYGDGLFVVCGNGNTIFASSSGDGWWKAAEGQSISSVTYSDGRFVGWRTGTLSTSPDGERWTPAMTVSGVVTPSGMAATCGDGRFVVGGNAGSVSTSTDGVVWTPPYVQMPEKDAVTGITYGNGMFVACCWGRTSTSTDGITWTPAVKVTGVSNLTGITYGNGMFVVCGGWGRTSTSTDGITWTPAVTVTGVGNLNSITYSNSMFVVCGDNGFISTSLDGVAWTPYVQMPEKKKLNGITYGNGMFVVCGDDNFISTSLDGVTWTPDTTLSKWGVLYAIIYRESRFVVCGNGNTVYTSTDGVIWAKGKIPAEGWSGHWKGITWSGGKYIVCGSEGRISTSIDGMTWTPAQQIASARFNSIIANF